LHKTGVPMSDIQKVGTAAAVLGGSAAGAVSSGLVSISVTGGAATAGAAALPTVLAIAVGESATATATSGVAIALASGTSATATGGLYSLALTGIVGAAMPWLGAAAIVGGTIYAISRFIPKDKPTDEPDGPKGLPAN
jgi:hypothetical protein